MLIKYKNQYRYLPSSYIDIKEKEKSMSYNNYIILLLAIMILIGILIMDYNKVVSSNEQVEIVYEDSNKGTVNSKSIHDILDNLFEFEGNMFNIDSILITKDNVSSKITFYNNKDIDKFINYYNKNKYVKVKSMEYVKDLEDKYSFNVKLSYLR
ncbi:Uncharacterised protein [Clostridium putrefaciens]|uniref:Uncharacterized protein n=1 Tax=Clostridium putrefaciens TaxID=99675 RepID=A0A381J904_9CLOT|nr:hypothetical protein [Clostridium putrefaciens]SUY47198.1 Uncharacterised protein [Clostridium putrefaciens]